MLSVLLAAAILAGTGAAATPAPTAPPPPAGQAAEPKVCHVEPIQGSRITHKVCLTAAEAAQLERDARLLLTHAQAGYQPPNMTMLVPMGPMR